MELSPARLRPHLPKRARIRTSPPHTPQISVASLRLYLYSAQAFGWLSYPDRFGTVWLVDFNCSPNNPYKASSSATCAILSTGLHQMAHQSSSARTFWDTTRNDSPTRISSRSVDICFLISNAAGTCFSSFSEIHSRLCCRGRLYGPEMLEINAHIAAHSSCELLPATALLKKCHCNLSLILRVGSPVSKKSPLCKCQRQG